MRCAGVWAVVALLSACAGAGPIERGLPPSPLAVRVAEQFRVADVQKRERLTREEFAKGFPELAAQFDEIDVDRNGSINLAELQSYTEWAQLIDRTDRDRKPTGRAGAGF